MGSASRFTSIRDRTNAAVGVRFDARASHESGAADRFTARQIRMFAVPSRFSATKLAIVMMVAARFDASQPQHCMSGNRFDARAAANFIQADRFDARAETRGSTIARFLINAAVGVKSHAGHCNAYFPHGWELFARNADTGEVVRLGFILADASPKTLTDVPLADGVWEIEARTSQWFWDSCRGRKIVTLSAGEITVGGEPLQGIPAIQDLRRDLVDFRSVIMWRTATEYLDNNLRFGVWFGPASPVDTSGVPDLVLPYYPGYGDYQTIRAQTGSEYVAVAAFTDDDVGPVAEIELPWETDAPVSPSNQTATNGG